LLALLEDLGDVAGMVAFVAMAGLLILYVLRARELRMLRRSAPYLAEKPNGQPAARRSRRSAGATRRRR
jgi:hypothetical protein